MVKGEDVLISEFARVTGLTPDTVRFYVGRGLLRPETGAKGGANPYQIFTAEHVEIVRMVRMAQSLGFSLREIAALNEEYLGGGITRERSIAILSQQLRRLEEKAEQLNAMSAYLRAKVAWLERDDPGPEPSFTDFVRGIGRPLAQRHGTEKPLTVGSGV